MFLLLVLPLRQMFYLSEFLARTWKIGFDVDVKFWTCFAIAAGDLPDGQISKNAVHTQSQKYSASRLTRLKSTTPAIPSHKRGVSRSSRTLGTGCDGRGSVRRANSARTNGADAYGEVVWSWRPDAGVKVAEYPQATVARKPGHRGARSKS